MPMRVAARAETAETGENMPSLSARKQVLHAIRHSPERLTPLALQHQLQQEHGLSRQQVKHAVAELVQNKEIAYTYQFGCTFLEMAYDRPRRVSASIVIKPPACSYVPAPGDVVVDMRPGASFGIGQHPTTRLSLQGLDFLMHREPRLANLVRSAVLDVGTGSGILLITALKMGFSGGIGLDVDPCAVAEARENVVLNGLERRARILETPMEDIDAAYDLIMANLRLPTLVRILPLLLARTKEQGHMVLSGIKADEMKAFLIPLKAAAGLARVWQGEELGWGAVVLKKRPAHP